MTDRRRTDPLTGEVIEDPPIRPFADWLREQANGKTHNELGEALWDLIARVEETRKKGTLALTITVEPMPKSDGNVLVISDNIQLKLPEFKRDASVAYVDRNGNLSRNNPRQPTLTGLRDASAPESTTIREAQ
ncbi:hypothetical protein [Micropruina sp.]|uniref:hypothetical protein n=1 Tax=Micropruina sp. TaxID=2737536 RepID=UPI0039E694EC